MTPAELLGLSLLISAGVAGLGWLAASALERVSGDIALRERAWSLAFYLPVLPPLALTLLLLAPIPLRPILMIAVPLANVSPVSVGEVDGAPAVEIFHLDGEQAALVLLAATLLSALLRLVVLGRRGLRLGRLLARTAPVSASMLQSVTVVAGRLGVAVPKVRVCATETEAFLAGLLQPVLVLPSSLAEASDARVVRAVIAHELAHLKRGDHRRVWLEELLLAVLAVNVFLPLVRARCAAVREEACDAQALDGAGSDARRAYARSLVEALSSRTASSPMPVMTFTGSPRSQAMRRLQSILTPPVAAGRTSKLAVMAAGVALLTLAGVGTAAVASQVESAVAPANATRLTVLVSQVERLPFLLASGDVLRVSLVGEGEAPSMTRDMPITFEGRLPSRVFLDLDDRYFPARMPGRAYELKAEIRRADGRAAYASEPTTLRLAPRSQGQVEGMRPELVLRPAS